MSDLRNLNRHTAFHGALVSKNAGERHIDAEVNVQNRLSSFRHTGEEVGEHLLVCASVTGACILALVHRGDRNINLLVEGSGYAVKRCKGVSLVHVNGDVGGNVAASAVQSEIVSK